MVMLQAEKLLGNEAPLLAEDSITSYSALLRRSQMVGEEPLIEGTKLTTEEEKALS